jgi:hypothetical protein
MFHFPVARGFSPAVGPQGREFWDLRSQAALKGLTTGKGWEIL